MNLTEDQKNELLDRCVQPRVTKESIEDKIKHIDFLKHGITTIAVIVMQNDFKVIGHSTPAAAGNFNAELGEQYAYENAFKQLWQLEGYLLKASGVK